MDALLDLLEFGGHDGSDSYCKWCVVMAAQRKENMDPTANLKEQKRLAIHLQNGIDNDDVDPVDVARLAELVIALDEWIKGGGFLPAPWASVIAMRAAERMAEKNKP